MKTVFTLVVGAVVGAFLTWLAQSAPIFPPYPDPGHRFFGVKNEQAAAAVLEALAKSGGPTAKSAFTAGPTNQVVLNDGQRTVIGWFDASAGQLPSNGFSIAVDRPRQAADRARRELRLRGFTAEVKRIEVGKTELFVVVSDALANTALVYRKPWYKLSAPPARPMPKGEIKGDI